MDRNHDLDHADSVAVDEPGDELVDEPVERGLEVVDWFESDAPGSGDGTRHFEPYEEFERRSRAISRLGRAITIGFFLPVVGGAQQWISFPQLDLFNLGGRAAVLAVLPLVVGVAVIIAACFDGFARAAMVLAGGLSLVVALFGFDGAAGMLQGAWRLGSSPGQGGLVLLLFGMLGLFVVARVRWYRPMMRWAYGYSCVAAACYVCFLCSPIAGVAPIVAVYHAFDRSVLLGGALGAHVLCAGLAVWLTIRNTPSVPAANAARRAGWSSRWLVLSLVVPLVVLGVALLGELGRATQDVGPLLLQWGSWVVKGSFILGGMILLIPVGFADLWLGRSDARTAEEG